MGIDKLPQLPLTTIMDWFFTKACATHSATAVCVATLLLAANDLDHNHPSSVHQPAQPVVCIATAQIASPPIQFSKGLVIYRSSTGRISNRKQFDPANGDTIATGNNGFVSILLENGKYHNVQPVSQVRFGSSKDCYRHFPPAADDDVVLEKAYLTAAIRG